MNRAALTLACVFLCTASAAAQDYIHGVFVGTSKGPVELLAYAELDSKGRMRMADGASFEDVPQVDRVQRILCSLPNWTPTGVWMSSDAIFRDERAERRLVAMTSQKLNVYTIELRVADLEDAEKLTRLVRQVRPNGTEPAFVFIAMALDGGASRHYMVRVR